MERNVEIPFLDFSIWHGLIPLLFKTNIFFTIWKQQFFFQGTISITGLKWVRVNVPQYRIPGETATLQCHYNLGNSSLYAVKWYKEHEEFYRFVPKARPQSSSYEVDGVYVDVSISNTFNNDVRSCSFVIVYKKSSTDNWTITWGAKMSVNRSVFTMLSESKNLIQD